MDRNQPIQMADKIWRKVSDNLNVITWLGLTLIPWGWDKMTDILQMTFQNIFSCLILNIKSQGIVREFCYGSGKIKNVVKSQGKVREFWTGHGYGGFMSNLKHFGQHPHSLLMELLASVTWMSSSYNSLDISLMSDKLIYNFPSNYTWKLFSSHETEGFGTPCNHAINIFSISWLICHLVC